MYGREARAMQKRREDHGVVFYSLHAPGPDAEPVPVKGFPKIAQGLGNMLED